MKKGKRTRGKSIDAQMPLALIAVALLAVGSFYCVICAEVERSADNIHAVTDEFEAVDDEIERARLNIETSIGEIIADLSKTEGENLLKRTNNFESRVDSALKEKYPSFCKGVTTHILNSDIHLNLETMRLDGEDALSGETKPSFFRASGTVDLRFVSESTVTERTIDIVADSASALPLIVDSATRFELSVEGSNSALKQLMEYQLSAVAQNRIMSGYGMLSAGGEHGTHNIITNEDVEEAYRSSISILQTMFFRSNGEDASNLLTNEYLDAAEYIIAEDGRLAIDVGAMYAQAMIADLDKYVTQWLDYLCISSVLDIADSIGDFGVKCIEEISKFVTGKDCNAETVRNHIKSRMAQEGYAYKDYAIIEGGVTLTVPEYSFKVMVGLDFQTIKIPESKVFIPYPEKDLISWSGWEGFMSKYEENRNQFRESIRSIIKQVAANIQDNCIVYIDMDPFDTESFSENIISEFKKAVSECDDRVKNETRKIIESSTIDDPLMCSAYEHIISNYRSVYGTSKTNSVANSYLKEYVSNQIEENMPEGSVGVLTFLSVNNVVNKIDKSAYSEEYMNDVNKRLQFLEKSMTSIDTYENNPVIIGMSLITGELVDLLNLRSAIEETVIGIGEVMTDVGGMNPYDGILTLPGTDTFRLMSTDGKTHNERLDVHDSSYCDIEITSPMLNSSDNIHYVGFGNHKGASYCAYFDIDFNSTLSYTVTGSNPVYQALGITDSTYTGSVTIDLDMSIPCISGWALTGVSYNLSNTIIGDAWNALLTVLEPLLEPLRVLYEAVQSLLNICTTAIVEFSTYLNEMFMKIYEVLSIPLEYIKDAWNNIISGLTDTIAVKAMELKLNSQTITFDLFGLVLTVDMNLRSLSKSTKELFTLTLGKTNEDGSYMSASMTIKSSTSKGTYMIIGCHANGSDWSFDIDLDPLLKSGSQLIRINGNVRNVAYEGTLPELIQYNELSISLASIPGVGDLISNIPLPLAGAKGSIDAGLQIKYGLPIRKALVINEVELNPEGTDSGNEWVELFNNTDEEVNLEGYKLVPDSGEHKTKTLGNIVLAPNERIVIYFEGQKLTNKGSDGKGERVTLLNADGDVVDRTSKMKDEDNSDWTWQRTMDASTDWVYMKNSEDAPNGGKIPGGYLMKNAILNYAKEAAIETLDEMGGLITSVDGLTEYMKRVSGKVIDMSIDRVADTLVEANAFVKLEITDYAETQHAGIRLMLGIDSEIVDDTLSYLASMLPVIGEYVSCPEGLTAERILYEDVYLRILIYGEITTPGFLENVTDSKVGVGLSTRFNLSAISGLFGEATGKWNAQVGIVMEDIPSYMVPSFLEADKNMSSDLWLFKMSFTEM